jgi:septum formation protein
MSEFVYLASKSPRRHQLLEQIGVRFELLLPDALENAEALETEQAGELPSDYVRRVTLAKLEASRDRRVRHGLPIAPVLCADTTVSLGCRILGKPANPQEAFKTLQLLSGQTHQVFTAVALAWKEKIGLTLSISNVRFAALSEAQIWRYIQTEEPFEKAGAYAIQSAAASWVSHIEGSYSGIMGLPLFETSELLRQAGWPI